MTFAFMFIAATSCAVGIFIGYQVGKFIYSRKSKTPTPEPTK